jgi:DNA-binding transcriptional regulator YiaG
MTHANRSKATRGIRPGSNPTPHQVQDLRESVNMNFKEFGALSFHSAATTEAWETGEKKMHPVIWMFYKHIFDRETIEKLKE